MATIAFLGLGKMDRGVVQNLRRAGHTVAAWNRSPEKAQHLAAEGITIAVTPADAAKSASPRPSLSRWRPSVKAAVTSSQAARMLVDFMRGAETRGSALRKG